MRETSFASSRAFEAPNMLAGNLNPLSIEATDNFGNVPWRISPWFIATAPAAAPVIYYLFGDHLGSNSMTLDLAGEPQGVARYLPYGQPRAIKNTLLTDKTFTGQREEDFGLMDYNARYFSPLLGRFVSADSIIPGAGDPLAWDRYLYGLGNSIRYSDPTGHFACGDGIEDPRCDQYDPSTLPSTRTPNSPTTTDEPTLPSPNDAITTSIIVIDGVSFIISGVEAVLADIVGGGIIVIGCGATGLETAGLGCGVFAGIALEVDVAIASYGSPIGAVENLLGIASTSLTWYSDQDNIWTPDSSYISVGKDTVVSVRNTVLGQVPESNIDALISYSQLKYDLERLEGVDPGGRVVIISNGGGNPSLGKDLLDFLLYGW